MTFLKKDSAGRFCRLLMWAMILCLAALCASDAFAARKRRPPKKKIASKKGVVSKAAFQARVRRAVKRQCVRPGRLGLYIRSVSTAQTLYSHNAARKRIPASNVKLFTAAAALAHLGPDYRFATDFYVKDKVRGGVLRGDLYLKGYGDPLFVHEKMRDFVRRLKLRGVRRIEGDLVADDTFFDEKKHGRGWRVGRSIRPYLAPHGALSLNFGLANVLVAPGDRVGGPARANLEPSSRALRLWAKVKTSRGKHPKIWLGRRRSKGKDLVQVGGSFPVRSRMRTYRVPVTDPTAFTAGAVAAEFERQGIALKGRIRRAVTPPDAKLLARNLSPPLGEVVSGLNKFSNNFVAEQVLKTMGAEAHGAPGTAEKGLRVVRDFLLSTGVLAKEIALADGSGLSRMNRASPRALAVLLEAAHNDFRLRPEFMASLAVFGVDGTVKKRRRRGVDSRRVRVKTGVLNGVRAFSGYAAARNGEIIAFSILMNGNACRPKSLTGEVVRAMVALNRNFSNPVNAHLRGAREIMARPMPKPSIRDGWRRRSSPRPDPAEEDDFEELGPGIVPIAESPLDDSPDDSPAEKSAEAAPVEGSGAWSSKSGPGGRSRE
ncbi:MAG: D-alanyl-D-alanine carboxypeptidase/D-alanyl-D-alanine-endopeptidase [Nitrospinae bacterium]|nr:D-alanyl-D-alanine carboxypeptidase/D-alanyl-D-alanine-endopeptidase [Nitrospinota bacterium]